ncbi:MAG: hypothetical protein Q9169_004964 [Polycauliona sp. 2 TL-2023]
MADRWDQEVESGEIAGLNWVQDESYSESNPEHLDPYGEETEDDYAADGSETSDDSINQFIPLQLRPRRRRPGENDGEVRDWDDSQYSDQEEQEAQIVEPSRRAYLRRLTATIKCRFHDRLPRLRKHSADETVDDWWANEVTDDADWNNDETLAKPTISTRFTKTVSVLKSFITGSRSKLEPSNDVGAGDAGRPPFDPWDTTSLREREAARKIAAHDEPRPEITTLNFTDPLSTSPEVKGKDFLSRFLANPRDIAIHPDRIHKLAAFMLRLCLESCYDHVKIHAPEELTWRDINSADEMEFEHWVNMLSVLRWQDKIPGVKGGDCWYEPYLKDLRHKAEHREEYDSQLVKYVAWHLEKLDDEPRRSQLGDALEQVYTHECAMAVKRKLQTNAEDLDAEAVSVSPTIPTDHGTFSSATTLVGSDSNKSTYMAIDDVPASAAAVERPICIPAIERPTLITTYNQFLKSLQDILENCLFNHLRCSNPDYLIRNKTVCSSQIELNGYERLFMNGNLKFGNQDDRPSIGNLLYGARKLRNAAAHNSRAGTAQCLTESECNSETTASFYQNALELALLASDSDAIYAIRLAAWVADINLSKTALQKYIQIMDTEKVVSNAELNALYAPLESEVTQYYAKPPPNDWEPPSIVCSRVDSAIERRAEMWGGCTTVDTSEESSQHLDWNTDFDQWNS